MDWLTVYPGLLRGSVTPPPSKSLAHRAILCAALAGGLSEIGPVQPSDDIRATLGCACALGAEVKWRGNCVQVRGTGGKSAVQSARMDCGESGSTLRFLVPLALAMGVNAGFTGRGNLGKRPLSPYETICRAQGLGFEHPEDATLPLQVSGRLKSGKFTLPGDVSSQFVTGLLLALPLLEGDSEIEIQGALQSRGYIDLTLSAMKAFGVEVECPSEGRYRVPGGQSYRARDYQVEADFSQAAFFLCAGALGAQVDVLGLRRDSLQGDRAVIPMLRELGALVEWKGEALSARPGNMRGAVLDAAQCPDIMPELALVAALCPGHSRIVNAARLRIKECDRLHAIAQELNRLGGKVVEFQDSLEIDGVEMLEGGVQADSFSDHRMAMMLAIASQKCRLSISIRNPGCVSKSYPGFFDDFRSLGGTTE